MPVTTANVPILNPEPEKPAKAKATKPDPLADAMKSNDPAVLKLLWDRGVLSGEQDPDAVRRVSEIDAELARMGFTV